MKINYKGHQVEGTVREIQQLIRKRKEFRENTKRKRWKLTKKQRKRISKSMLKRWAERKE